MPSRTATPARAMTLVTRLLPATLLLAACARAPESSPAIETAPVARAVAAPCPGDNGGITLPDGFCATVFADSLGATRHIAVAANGDVFVNVAPPRGPAGATPVRSGIIALRDTDRDGRANQTQRFGERGGTGIALYGGYVYQDVGPAIVRWPVTAGELTPSGGDADTVVSEMPTGGHGARSFVITSDGTMYVNVGSRTNACQERDRQNESAGVDPCVELETRAGIWKFSAAQTGQRFSPGARWATGIRIAVALALGPDGSIYAVQHGRDQLAQNWASQFTEAQNAELPAEELMRVREGDDFGWPYCYYDGQQAKRVLAPEYGGDGRSTDRCGDRRLPIAVFPAHWGPNALLIYTGSMFPQQYRGGAFIAFHGSWNRAPLPQGGYNVVFVRLGADGDRPVTEVDVFADGFAGTTKEPRQATYRPTGLAQAPDGALYITDDQRGRIWRVTYAR